MSRTPLLLLWTLIMGSGCSADPPEAPNTVEALLTPAVNPQRWSTYERSVMAQAAISQALSAPLLSARASLNLADAKAAIRPGTDGLHTALTQFEAAAWRFVQKATPEAYMALGRRQGLTLIKMIDARIATNRPLIVDSATAKAHAYLKLAGSFPIHAQREGLLTGAALTTRVRCQIQGLFMANWSSPINQRIGRSDYILPLERECLLRWRVETGRQQTLEKRVSAAQELAASRGYPGHVNAAILLWRAGRHTAAREALSRSKHPAAKRLRSRFKRPQASP